MTYWLQLTILYCALKCFVKRIDLMLSILTTKKKEQKQETQNKQKHKEARENF